MIVCSCHAFNEARVRQALADVAQGRANPPKVKEIYAVCAEGRRPQCGQCLVEIRQMRDAFCPCG